jgi:hypothetical protein
MLGEQVDILVNNKLERGKYSYDWNAGKFPSGIYYYQLQSEGFSDTKKLILIK